MKVAFQSNTTKSEEAGAKYTGTIGVFVNLLKKRHFKIEANI